MHFIAYLCAFSFRACTIYWFTDFERLKELHCIWQPWFLTFHIIAGLICMIWLLCPVLLLVLILRLMIDCVSVIARHVHQGRIFFWFRQLIVIATTILMQDAANLLEIIPSHFSYNLICMIWLLYPVLILRLMIDLCLGDYLTCPSR